MALDRREQRGTQRPHVRGGARASAAGAFGRKVGRRPEQHPRYGQGRAVGGLGDPEIGQYHPAFRAEQDVSRFHVTVHHAGLVHGAEGGQDAQADPGRLGRGHGPVFGHSIAQRAERHEFHDDGRPVALLDDVVHADHIRMADPRGQLRFPHGPPRHLPLFRVELHRPDDFLDRHVAVEQFVARPPDGTHPAAADDGKKPVPSGQQSLRLAGQHLL